MLNFYHSHNSSWTRPITGGSTLMNGVIRLHFFVEASFNLRQWREFNPPKIREIIKRDKAFGDLGF